MSVEENKTALLRIMAEVWNEGNLEVIPELVSPDYVYREANREFRGPAGYRTLVTNWRVAFPDAHYTIDDMVAEDDKVSCRLAFQGTFKGRLGSIEPTGKEIHLAEATFSRWVGGKVVEVAAFFDTLTLYQQMGVRPPGS
jgi:predicted ester cyclase